MTYTIPYTPKDTQIKQYPLILNDMIKSAYGDNEEFLEKMRSSIQSFFDSSMIAREASAKTALKNTRAKLYNLLTWSMDSNGMFPPQQDVVKYAESWVVKLFLEAKNLHLDWIEPNVTANEDGEVVFEWWHDKRKLTIYIEGQNAEYVQVWGDTIDAAISDGNAKSIEVCRSLWIWLVG